MEKQLGTISFTRMTEIVELWCTMRLRSLQPVRRRTHSIVFRFPFQQHASPDNKWSRTNHAYDPLHCPGPDLWPSSMNGCFIYLIVCSWMGRIFWVSDFCGHMRMYYHNSPSFFNGVRHMLSRRMLCALLKGYRVSDAT